MKKTPAAIGAVAIGLIAASAAFAHDTIEMRRLDQEKRIEALSTSSVVLTGDLKPMPIAVMSARGPMRNVGVIIADMRAAYRPTFLATFNRPEYYGERGREDDLRRHPVGRIAGTVDCRTGRAMWNSFDYSDTTVAAASITTKLKNPGDNGNLPRFLDEEARISICATNPANA